MQRKKAGVTVVCCDSRLSYFFSVQLPHCVLLHDWQPPCPQLQLPLVRSCRQAPQPLRTSTTITIRSAIIDPPNTSRPSW